MTATLVEPTDAPVLLDFESRSRVPLSGKHRRTPRQYWTHSSTQALCCAWYDTATGEAGVWTPGEDWPHDGRVLAAHNWHGFDRFGADRLGWRCAGGIDTSQLARKAGLPGALDALGQRWLGTPKDDEGSRFTKSLSAVRCPRRPKHVPVAEWRAWWASLDDDARRVYGVQPMLTDEGFARVIDYCENDVVILAEAWPRLSEWLDVDADAERVDAAVNDRGVWFDRDLARALIAHDARIGEQACDVAAAALGWTADRVRAAANSPAQFCAATGSSDAQALTVETLDHPLARAREALASIARGKLEAGLRLANDDGRLRDSHRYYGGHTGRWSGQGVQTQNMPRPAKHLEDVDTDALADAVLAGDVADADIDADVVSLLVRAAIAAAPGYELACADFAQVEGRASAWFAGDEDAVRVYTSGADPYTIAAEHIAAVCPMPAGVKPRQIGKCAELALGYGGGPGAFAKIAQGNRVDLSAFSGADRRRIVDAWRDLHAPIVRFWYAAEAAMRKAIDGRPAWCKAFQFVPGGADVACFLPSGRPIVYNGIRLSPQEGRKPRITYLPAGEDEQRAAPYCPDCMRRLAPTKFCGCGAELRGQSCPQHGKPATSYRMCPQHGLVEAALRADVYGGKLVENMVQAYCRDLMADALVRTEAAGLRPVMHVHDEIVCEVPEGTGQEALAELLHVMSTLPAWAAGFPIGADGWHGRRYRK